MHFQAQYIRVTYFFSLSSEFSTLHDIFFVVLTCEAHKIKALGNVRTTYLLFTFLVGKNLYMVYSQRHFQLEENEMMEVN